MYPTLDLHFVRQERRSRYYYVLRWLRNALTSSRPLSKSSNRFLKSLPVLLAYSKCIMTNASSFSQPNQHPFTVATNGIAEPSSMTSATFLLSKPTSSGSVYTTARTCAKGTRILEWETHVTRIANSAAEMIEKGRQKDGDGPEEKEGASRSLLDSVADPVRFRAILNATVRAATKRHLEVFGRDGNELKITVLLSGEDRPIESSLACHVGPLPPPPKPPVRVEIRGTPRSDASAKSTSWVEERSPLEALMRGAALGSKNAGGVNEFLLVSARGEIMEGSQTNFFAWGYFDDGHHECKPPEDEIRDKWWYNQRKGIPFIQTASGGILEGTIRRLFLEVCEREGIPVIFTPPLLKDAPTWEGCFISSTSRLLLPVDELYQPCEGGVSRPEDLLVSFETGPESFGRRLSRLVESKVEAHSTEIV